MKLRLRKLFVMTLGFNSMHLVAQPVVIQPTWLDLFKQCQVAGTMVVYDSQTKTYFASDDRRAKQRFIPASTFKIPHTLFALKSAVVSQQTSTFKWRGEPQPFQSWQMDQTLTSAFQKSVPWVYQILARRIGEEAERRYLTEIAYGNASVNGGIDQFWLTGDLAISADEQVKFLIKLESETLPFAAEDQRFVKDLMLVDAGPSGVLRAKSGWAFDKSPQIGWYVGWLEIDARRVFFALNMTVTASEQQLSCRSQIAREILQRVRDFK